MQPENLYSLRLSSEGHIVYIMEFSNSKRNTWALSIQGVMKSFVLGNGDVLPVLDKIDIEVSSGEFLAILGPSGCGKSTLLNIIAGIETLDEGEVHYEPDLQQNGKRKIAVAWQEESLMPWKTVFGNIEFPLIVINMPRQERDKRVQKWIERINLDGFSHYYPSQLSQGMRKRVALASALVAEPRLLLMDEPFSALDLYTKRQIEKEVVRLWESLDATIILITHDVYEAAALADRIVVLTDRPARVKSIRNVSLPRPRDLDTIYGLPEFHEIVRGLWTLLTDQNEK